MEYQEIVVYLVVLACAGWIILHVFSFIRKTKKGESPCDNCPTGCELRDLFNEKQQECSIKGSEEKKKKE